MKKTTMEAYGLLSKPQVGTISDELKTLYIAKPAAKEKEVVIKVVSSIIHVDDISIAQGTALGRFLGPKEVTESNPWIMGSTYTGLVESLGNGVTKFKIGDAVLGIPIKTGEGGSWAEFKCVHEDNIRLKPENLSHQQSAALLLGGCVAYGMFVFADVKKGDKCLVLGASGGIGSTVLKMLKSQGAEVIALCSTRNIEAVKKMNPDRIIDYTKSSFVNILIDENIKVDYVFDSVGGLKLERDGMKVLKQSGTFLTVCGPVQYIGAKKLSWLRTIDMFGHIMVKSLFSGIFGPSYKFSEKLPSLVIDDMFNLCEKEAIEMKIDRVIPFNLKSLKENISYVSSHKATGRVVIDMTLDRE